MAEEAVPATAVGGAADGALKVVLTFPLIKQSDMPEEMRNESTEICVSACEKYTGNNEGAARMIKENMDKKFGPTWHVVVGEGFGFIITYEIKSLLYLFFGGNVGVCVWKCA